MKVVAFDCQELKVEELTIPMQKQNEHETTNVICIYLRTIFSKTMNIKTTNVICMYVQTHWQHEFNMYVVS